MKCRCALLVVVSLSSVVRAHAQAHPQLAIEEPAESIAERGSDHAEAKRVFETGRRAFEMGRFDEAAERFEHAYALSGKPELLFDVGVAADRLRDDDWAIDAFERYLQHAGNSPLRAQVERRIAALRAARERARWAAEREQPSAAATVPSPAQVAVASRQSAPSSMVTRSSAVDDAAGDDDGLLSQWWFWAGAAALVSGGAIAGYVLTREPEAAAAPLPNTGVVVSTLGFAP